MTAGAPWFVLVAGVNGAGKSTFAQNPHSIKTLCGLTGAADEIEIINPDLITVEIMGMNHSLSLDHANKHYPLLEIRDWLGLPVPVVGSGLGSGHRLCRPIRARPNWPAKPGKAHGPRSIRILRG